MFFSNHYDSIIIGGGPAGLMAADILSANNKRVLLVDQMQSLGRKFLMAGKSGLNLTNSQSENQFISAYRPNLPTGLQLYPKDIIEWANDLGANCFIGSSGMVFPKEMKASGLLRAWIKRLEKQNVEIRTNTQWVGLNPEHLLFKVNQKEYELMAKTTIFALGGASWSKLGSKADWADAFPTRPFIADNVGIEVDWTHKMHSFEGAVVKNVAIHSGENTAYGDITLTKYGLIGAPIYKLSQDIPHYGFTIDLLPHISHQLFQEIEKTKDSLGNFIRKKFNLGASARALFFEWRRGNHLEELKSLSPSSFRTRPLDEAISTVGGIDKKSLTGLALTANPHVFCAGEMIDWGAPTGGYLLTACLSQGFEAAQAANKIIEAF